MAQIELRALMSKRLRDGQWVAPNDEFSASAEEARVLIREGRAALRVVEVKGPALRDAGKGKAAIAADDGDLPVTGDA